MKDSRNAATLLELPFSPGADEYLDEMERSGQFRIGAEAEESDPDEPASCIEYFWGRGSGSVCIQDWWTTGLIALRIGPGVAPAELVLGRLNDSLVLRTDDGFDRLVLEGYLGLIPDASTLRIVFADGSDWTGDILLARVTSWVAETAPAIPHTN